MTSWRTLAKRSLALPLVPCRALRTPARRWVLTFHEVGDHRWACSPASFERILESVRASAEVLPLEALLGADDSDGLRVAVTFDDGYLGVAKEAVPILERLAVPATVFLPTGLLGEEDALPSQDRALYVGVPLMGWRTVKRLSSSALLRFESHGAAHRPLQVLSEQERADDLRSSRKSLESATGRPSRLLAYPFGAADGAVASTARDVGFIAAFTTRHGGLRAGADPYLLPRVDIRADYTPRDVLAILKGDWDYLAWAQALRGRLA